MPVASLLGGITHAVTSLVGDHAVYAVFALMLVDALLPAASEVVMVYGGAVAAGAFAAAVTLPGADLPYGWPAYVAVALAGTLGYTLGSVVGWAIGRYGGRPFVERHGRLLHASPETLARADRWFARYGQGAVLVARVTPLVRSLVSVPAGMARLRLGPYTALTLLGSAIWCFGLAAVGWALGASWERFHGAFRYADYAVAGLLLAAVALLVVRRRSSRLARRAADPAR